MPGLVWALFWAQLAAQTVSSVLPAGSALPGTLAVVFLQAGFSVTHLALRRGFGAAGAYLAATISICGGLEALSVATGFPFGWYRYATGLGPAVLGVPLLVPLAWSMMAYPAWCVARAITPPGWRSVVVAALALTAWDLFLDPRMTQLGLWVWEYPGPYAGVPIGNFAGWLLTSLILFAVLAKVLNKRPALAPARFVWFDWLPVLAFAFTWVGTSAANLVLWRQPLPAVVSGIGMGLAAAPGLVALGRAWLAHAPSPWARSRAGSLRG